MFSNAFIWNHQVGWSTSKQIYTYMSHLKRIWNSDAALPPATDATTIAHGCNSESRVSHSAGVRLINRKLFETTQLGTDTFAALQSRLLREIHATCQIVWTLLSRSAQSDGQVSVHTRSQVSGWITLLRYSKYDQSAMQNQTEQIDRYECVLAKKSQLNNWLKPSQHNGLPSLLKNPKVGLTRWVHVHMYYESYFHTT